MARNGACDVEKLIKFTIPITSSITISSDKTVSYTHLDVYKRQDVDFPYQVTVVIVAILRETHFGVFVIQVDIGTERGAGGDIVGNLSLIHISIIPTAKATPKSKSKTKADA